MLTLFKARSVITMNPSMPRASAVLVRDGMILEVGEPENMAPWMQDEEVVVNDQFAHSIICPGFIDPPTPQHGSVLPLSLSPLCAGSCLGRNRTGN